MAKEIGEEEDFPLPDMGYDEEKEEKPWVIWRDGVKMVFLTQKQLDELAEKHELEAQEYHRRMEEASGQESCYLPAYGPNPRPMSFAQLKRQTFRRKRTSKSIPVSGMYIIDKTDPKHPVKPITTQFPPNTDFGWTKDHYIVPPNPAADPEIVPGPASGTRSQVKRRQPLLLDPDLAHAKASRQN